MDIDPAFKERLKAIFDEFDDDGGGDIDTEELGQVMEQLGQHCTEAELHVRTNAARDVPTWAQASCSHARTRTPAIQC